LQAKFRLPGPPRPGGLQGPASQGLVGHCTSGCPLNPPLVRALKAVSSYTTPIEHEIKSTKIYTHNAYKNIYRVKENTHTIKTNLKNKDF